MTSMDVTDERKVYNAVVKFGGWALPGIVQYVYIYIYTHVYT